MNPSPKRLGFFTRLLDEAPPAERYRLAAEQIIHAERAASTPPGSRSIISTATRAACRRRWCSWPMWRPARPRSGSGPASSRCRWKSRCGSRRTRRCWTCCPAGGWRSASGPAARRRASRPSDSTAPSAALSSAATLRVLRDAWAGRPLAGTQNRLYPAAESLAARVWQATFSVEGGRRAGEAGDGLLLSRTQPRPKDAPSLSLAAIQNPIIDAYLAALPEGRAPRIVGSRTRVRRGAARGGAAARRHRAAPRAGPLQGVGFRAAERQPRRPHRHLRRPRRHAGTR